MTRIKIRNILNIVRLNVKPICILIIHILCSNLLILEIEISSLVCAVSPFQVFEAPVDAPDEVDGPLTVHFEILWA